MNGQIVEYKSDLNCLESRGKLIYSTNEHFRNLSTVMEHPEFRNFYNTYLKDIEDAKTMLMFMKIYDYIETRFKGINPYQKISILKEILDNSESRKRICDAMTTCDFSLEKKHRNCIQ
jgi:hypothetical protein